MVLVSSLKENSGPRVQASASRMMENLPLSLQGHDQLTATTIEMGCRSLHLNALESSFLDYPLAPSNHPSWSYLHLHRLPPSPYR